MAPGPLAALFLYTAAAGAAPGVSISISKPSEKPVLGEPFHLEYEVSWPADYAIILDTAALPSGAGDFGVLEHSFKGKGPGGGKFRIKAVPFAMGISTFPSLSLLLSGPDGEFSAIAPDVPLEIEPFIKEQTPPNLIRDIYPPFRFGVPRWAWWLPALAAAAAAALWWKRRRRGFPAGGAPAGGEPALPPYENALRELDRLLSSGLWDPAAPKTFYASLSAILRDYLDGEGGMEAQLMTTSDLLKELRKKTLTAPLLADSRAFLNKADLVKFARLPVSEQERDSDADKLRALLGGLHGFFAPPPPPPPPGQGGAR